MATDKPTPEELLGELNPTPEEALVCEIQELRTKLIARDEEIAQLIEVRNVALDERKEAKDRAEYYENAAIPLNETIIQKTHSLAEAEARATTAESEVARLRDEVEELTLDLEAAEELRETAESGVNELAESKAKTEKALVDSQGDVARLRAAYEMTAEAAKKAVNSNRGLLGTMQSVERTINDDAVPFPEGWDADKMTRAIGKARRLLEKPHRVVIDLSAERVTLRTIEPVGLHIPAPKDPSAGEEDSHK